MLTEHGRRVDEFSKNFNKEVENMKNKQNWRTEMKNILEKIDRLEDAEESIANLERKGSRNHPN